MNSLLFGLTAALAWGIHDVCIRYVSQRVAILPMMAVVLGAGLVVLAPFGLALGDWPSLTGQSATLAVLAGLVYVGAGYGLYQAFAIGPVRLVAPIVAAFPVLSLGWAAAQGHIPTPMQGIAVLAIIGGVIVIAVLSDETGDSAHARERAIFWAIVAAMGFAITFALGQAAERTGGGLAALTLTRTVAVGVVLLLIALRRPAFPGRNGPWMLLVTMGCLDALALGLVLTAGGLPHPEFASVTASIFGMVTILLAWVFLKERVAPLQWGGVLMVFSGIGYLAA
ncbi:MAG: DMT family transporter [Albidovulum sp.]